MTKDLKQIKEDAIARADNLLSGWANPTMGMLLGMTAHPLLGVAWLTAFGTFTYVSTAATNKLDKFVELLKEGKFKEDDIQAEGFCEGLNVLFEAFMKARSEVKMNIIRRILLGFSSTGDRQRFHLERLCLCANSISLETLHFLSFLKEEVVPKLKQEFEKTWLKENPDEKDRWYKYVSINSPLGEYLHQFDPNNPKACKKYGYDPSKGGPEGDPPDQAQISLQMWRDQRYKDAEFYDAISELIGMGILKIEVDTTYNQSSPIHFLTEYGIEFMNFVFGEDLRI